MRSLIEKVLGLLKPAALNRSASVPVPTSEHELQIRALMNRLNGAVNKKALPELLDMLADDVVLLSTSGAPVVGRNAVKALCTDLYGRYNIRHEHELSGARVIGTVAMNMGGHITTLTPLDGGNTEGVRGGWWQFGGARMERGKLPDASAGLVGWWMTSVKPSWQDSWSAKSL